MMVISTNHSTALDEQSPDEDERQALTALRTDSQRKSSMVVLEDWYHQQFQVSTHPEKKVTRTNPYAARASNVSQ